MNDELLAQIQNKSNNATSDAPVKKMSPEQIRNRRRTAVNNVAERQMFGFTSTNYQHKIKSKL